MVAQGLSDNKYWLASYGTNPYVQNKPTNTAWYALNTVTFSGAPVIADDGVNGLNPANLYIIGPAMPTGTGLAMYKWNIATATASQVTLTSGNLPGAAAGSTTSCSSVSAFTNTAGTSVGVYCVDPTGALYSTTITIPGGVVANWSNTPLLNSVAYAPQIAGDGAGNYLALEQTTGSPGVYYQYFTGGYATLTSGADPFGFGPPLATTCLTTPSASYVMASKLFAVACTASDTHQMWANVYFRQRQVQRHVVAPGPAVTLGDVHARQRGRDRQLCQRSQLWPDLLHRRRL